MPIPDHEQLAPGFGPPPPGGPAPAPAQETPVHEAGGPPGPEPTRYGDWERKGIAVDF